jgi:hypothetical protein
MLKNLSQLEHKIGSNVYSFLCDPNSPLNEVKDALLKFLTFVGQVEDQVKAQQDAAQKAEAPAEQAPDAPKEEQSAEAVNV